MSRPISFHPNDDFGLFPTNKKYPYFSIKLTKDQVQSIKGKIAGIYEIEGKQTFKIKNENGELQDEEVLYVVWV